MIFWMVYSFLGYFLDAFVLVYGVCSRGSIVFPNYVVGFFVIFHKFWPYSSLQKDTKRATFLGDILLDFCFCSQAKPRLGLK